MDAPPLIEQYDLNFEEGLFCAATLPMIDIFYDMQPNEIFTDNFLRLAAMAY
ncbi:hypothetical protein H0A36_29295 [Endozoicomonas sp. SM1973]|uniref:Uncharacterized protein n=1 Tax=Spartinivicinus marinus TaxID=2994442 RepID=A0A853IE48_9GAMM|nr:hypothetical protein [Spartinivicinus marinus]NYZ70112.1 hypothetical protein [Spartinivicinus marinus]